MARKKSRTKPSKTRAATPAPSKKRSGPTPAAKPNSEVEGRWNEYWAQRQALEGAVERVRQAKEALDAARTAEQTLRAQFEDTKRELKSLLDVAPADGTDATSELPLDGLN